MADWSSFEDADSLLATYKTDLEADVNANKNSDVTVGIVFEDSWGAQFGRRHVTATYFGLPNARQFAHLLETCAGLADQKNIHVTVTGHDFFGPDNDIPVALVEFNNEIVRDALHQLHSDAGVPAPGMPWMPVPNFHCSFKGFGDIDSVKAVLPVGSRIPVKGIMAKRLGKADPFLLSDMGATRQTVFFLIK